MAKSKEPFKRHPCSVAVDSWLEDEEGQRCSKPAAFLETKYLVNRLTTAFVAGWCAGEKQAQIEMRVLKESRAAAVEQEQISRGECNRLRAELRKLRNR